MADIEIEIDGKKLTAKPNQTVIQVADEAGIYIPRYCYHKHMSIPANCRMCLVEIEKAPKTLPACATPVTPGMKVFTKSAKTLASQRAVMEFLLINHPLDCPVCDQGGECELQDLSMGYGSGWSHFDECKHSVPDLNLGPLIATEMTRCIKCTRCVRFGNEIAGLAELGVLGRGEDTDISTYVQHAIKSEVSGNIIDVCPVGALTSKPYRFTARSWELEQFPSISPHDCVGTNLNVHTRNGQVMRVVSRENNAINLCWLADRDRYSYVGLYHADRIPSPLVRIDGKLEVTPWQRALEIASLGLQESIAEFGADKFGALASPNSTLEEFYLLQKLVRGLNSPHIDHRLREIDGRDQAAMPTFPGLGMPIAELENSDAILLIGSHIKKEQPIIGLHVRKASLKGASVVAVNPVDYQFNFKLHAKAIVAPQEMVAALNEIANDLANSNPAEGTIAHALVGKQKVAILLGALALHHPQAAMLRKLAQKIGASLGAKVGFLTDGANSAGGWLAGAVPHRNADGTEINESGLSAYGMLEKPRKAYILLNVEPELDCANAALAIHAMQQADFIIALSIYRNPILEQYADVILPIAPFTETSGTYINAAGDYQSFTGAAKSFGESRPAWKVLRVLGNFLHVAGFDYATSEAVKHEVKALIDKMPSHVTLTEWSPTDQNTESTSAKTLFRIGEIPLYALDSLVRRSEPLQATQAIMDGPLAAVRLHPDTAGELHLDANDQVRVKQKTAVAELPLLLDSRIPKYAAWIAGGIPATQLLGDLIGEVEIERCHDNTRLK